MNKDKQADEQMHPEMSAPWWKSKYEFFCVPNSKGDWVKASY